MQRAIFAELRLHEREYPQLRYVIHVPNEGKRSAIGGKLAKDGGLQPGVLDMTALTGPRWALELKAGDNVPTPAQTWWMQNIAVPDGSYVGLAYTEGEAIDFILAMYRYSHDPLKKYRIAFWRACEWLDYVAESGQTIADPRNSTELKTRAW